MPLPAGGASAGRVGDASDDGPLLIRSLEAVAGHEAEIVTRFYELFFERAPEARPLFGAHSISEREEMVRETLSSVLAHAAGEPWLEENLAAMGRSHAEYGVESRSYADFVAAMLDTLDHVDVPGWCPPMRAAWMRALERITDVMRRAGDAHGGARAHGREHRPLGRNEERSHVE